MLARRVGPVRRGARGRPDEEVMERARRVVCVGWFGTWKLATMRVLPSTTAETGRSNVVAPWACAVCQRPATSVREEVMSQRPESKSLDDAPRRRAAQYRGRQTPPRPSHDTLRRFHGRRAGEVDDDPSELW